MRIAIAHVQAPFVQGGAEMLAENLKNAIQAAGHEADIISVPFKWYPAERIPEHMLACRLVDVTESAGKAIDRLIGLKFPAYLMNHPSKVLWLLHQFRGAYDMWGSPLDGLAGSPNGTHIREIVRAADDAFLPQCRAIYTISNNVSARLRHFNRIDSTPLYHPPPDADQFCQGEYSDFVLMPSRINPSKRQALLLDALARTRSPVRAVLIGGVDAPEYAEQLKVHCSRAGLEGRVNFLGNVDRAGRMKLYSECLAVVFPPLDEDYGYVTLEAMLSSKAVVTCTDSGGPLEFVLHRETGLVCAPDAATMAESLDLLWNKPGLARRYGRAGRARYQALRLSWDAVVTRLLA